MAETQEADPGEMVRIRLGDDGAIGGPVTREAFDKVWQHKGWVLLDEGDFADALEAERIARLKAPVEEVRKRQASTARATRKTGGEG